MLFRTAQVEVGDQAPTFALPDSTGEIISLADFEGQHVIVVLMRSLMCTFCRKHLIEMSEHAQGFAEAGAQLVVITPDSFEKVVDFSNRVSLNIPLLVDADHRVFESYGVMWKLRSLGRQPALYILDEQHRIVHKEFAEKQLFLPGVAAMIERIPANGQDPKPVTNVG